MNRSYALLTLAVLTIFGCQTPAQPSPDPSALVGRPARAPQKPVERGTLWYRVDASTEQLDVRVRLFNPPPQTRFFLPRSWGGRSDYARRIRIAGASDAHGPRFLTIDRSEGRIDVETEETEWVELHYVVELAEDSRFHPQYRRDVMVAYGPTFLVLPSQQILESIRDIPIELHAPAQWKVMTTWSPIERATSRSQPRNMVHGFQAADGHVLRDAFLVAGPGLRVQSRAMGTGTVHIGFDPLHAGDTDELFETTVDLLRAYQTRFGAIGDVNVFVQSREGDAPEFGGLGRRGGFVIELSPGPLDDDSRLLVAHEALHLWNGHALVPHPEHESRTRWFKEGVTHYIALKTLVRLGLVRRRFALEELARCAANYLQNPLARGERGTALDRTRFPYDRGVLLGVAIDSSLHRGSDGRVSIESWIVQLMESPTESETRLFYYDEARLLRALRSASAEVSAEPLRVWQHHVREQRTIDVSALFDTIDLHWLPPEPSRAARLIGFDRPEPLYRRLLGGA